MSLSDSGVCCQGAWPPPGQLPARRHGATNLTLRRALSSRCAEDAGACIEDAQPEAKRLRIDQADAAAPEAAGIPDAGPPALEDVPPEDDAQAAAEAAVAAQADAHAAAHAAAAAVLAAGGDEAAAAAASAAALLQAGPGAVAAGAVAPQPLDPAVAAALGVTGDQLMQLPMMSAEALAAAGAQLPLGPDGQPLLALPLLGAGGEAALDPAHLNIPILAPDGTPLTPEQVGRRAGQRVGAQAVGCWGGAPAARRHATSRAPTSYPPTSQLPHPTSRVCCNPSCWPQVMALFSQSAMPFVIPLAPGGALPGVAPGEGRGPMYKSWWEPVEEKVGAADALCVWFFGGGGFGGGARGAVQAAQAACFPAARALAQPRVDAAVLSSFPSLPLRPTGPGPAGGRPGLPPGEAGRRGAGLEPH